MTRIERDGAGFVVAAEVLAAAFGVEAAAVPGMLREGAITSRVESGLADDEGRFRLTFFHHARAFRLVVDAAGRILSRARFDAPRRQPVPFRDE